MTDMPPDDRDRPHPEWTRPPEPPIHRAARIGDLAALEELLAGGADLEERADLEDDNGPHLCGLTTLMVAARSIDGATTETLRWLVEHGADIRATSDGGNTAAWYAAGHGGRWAFHAKAVTPDHVQRLAYLLDVGLDPHECNFIGRSLLTEACGAGDPGRVRLLLERGVPATPPPTPLSPATDHSRPSMLAGMQDMLQSLGVPGPWNASTGDRSPAEIPIFCAAESGSAACVQLLLDAGADPNSRDSSGATPLMSAGSADVVRTLLAAGASRDAVNAFGDDALATMLGGGGCDGACGPERFAVARALLEAGADLERPDERGVSRLGSAAFGRHADAVDFLLDAGARADARSRDDHTPLHLICWQGESGDPDDNAACERIIRRLAATGIAVDATSDTGTTPLHEAAAGDWGNQTAIRTLLALGATPDPADEDGTTPLILAACNGDAASIELLLAAGADPSHRDADGATAVDAAADHLESWREIVADGPNMMIIDMERQTAEDIAREFGPPDDGPVFDEAAARAEQDARHRSTLAEAQRAFDILSRAANRGQPEAGSGPPPN